MPGEKGVAGFADVVDSDHVGALSSDGDGDSDGAEGSFFDGAAENFGEEAFAGVADQNGAIEVAQGTDVREQVDVVLGGFPEADSGVGDDSFASDAGLLQCVQAGGQEAADVVHDVVVMRIGLHGLRRAENVHADHAAVGLGADVDDFGFEPQAGDVVDDVGTGGEGLSGDFGFCRVDRDQSVSCLSNLSDDVDDSAEFFVD